MRKLVFGVSDQVRQTGLYNHRRWLEAGNFGFRKKRDSSIYVAKTKALIICAVTAQLICGFVFAYMQKDGFLLTRLIRLVLKLSLDEAVNPINVQNMTVLKTFKPTG